MNPTIVKYAGFAGAVVLIALYAAGFISEGIMLAMLNLIGFAGIGAVRAFIDSQGWKTYAVAAAGVIGSVVLALGYFPIETVQAWLAIWWPLGGSALAHALEKSKAG